MRRLEFMPQALALPIKPVQGFSLLLHFGGDVEQRRLSALKFGLNRFGDGVCNIAGLARSGYACLI